MADALTTNYGWVKPNVNDPAGVDLWGGKLNADLDGIDAQVFVNAQGVAALNAFGAGAGGFINKLRNGTFDVWQRGTSIVVPAATTPYTADGWIVAASGAGVNVNGVQAPRLGVAPNGPTVNVLQIQTTAAGSAQTQLVQRIESPLSAQLVGQNCTFQIWMYNGSASAITPSLSALTPNTQDNYAAFSTALAPTNLQPCPAGQWTRLAYTFAVPVAAGWGLQVNVSLGAALAAANAYVRFSEADLRATPGLPVGLCANPPPPELRPTAIEMAFCQRYYTTGQVASFVPGVASTAAYTSAYYKTRTRAAPTWALITNNSNGLTAAPTAIASLQYGDGVTIGGTAAATGPVLINCTFSASAEL